MVEVVVPDSRTVYWRDPTLSGDPDQLRLYGGTIVFVVQWASNTSNITSSMLTATKAILVGRHDTTLSLRVGLKSPVAASTATLAVRLSVENVKAVNGSAGSPTRKDMLLTLSDVKLLLLPASFDDRTHISRLLDNFYSP